MSSAGHLQNYWNVYRPGAVILPHRPKQKEEERKKKKVKKNKMLKDVTTGFL